MLAVYARNRSEIYLKPIKNTDGATLQNNQPYLNLDSSKDLTSVQKNSGNVRNRAHRLKDFENEKILKTVSDFKAKKALGIFSNSNFSAVKKTRFLIDEE